MSTLYNFVQNKCVFTDMFRCATFAQIGITFAQIKIKSIIAWYDRSITSKMYL